MGTVGIRKITKEDQIVIKISRTARSKKWKRVAQELLRQGFQRSDVECRQRYINHLDPNIIKDDWTDQELQDLYSKYDEYGNRWFLIQKHIQGRTQTKIKNYFYGAIRLFLKIMVKTTMNQGVGFINDINTDKLLNIYQTKSNNDTSLIHKSIKRLKYRVQKSCCQQLILENFQLYKQYSIQFINKYCEHRQHRHQYQQVQPLDQQFVKCQPSRNKLVVVNSISGHFIDKQNQLSYLKIMIVKHRECMVDYEQKYHKLLHSQQ